PLVHHDDGRETGEHDDRVHRDLPRPRAAAHRGRGRRRATRPGEAAPAPELRPGAGVPVQPAAAVGAMPPDTVASHRQLAVARSSARPASIRRKLVLVMLATTATALLVACAAMMYYDLRVYRSALLHDVQT